MKKVRTFQSEIIAGKKDRIWDEDRTVKHPL